MPFSEADQRTVLLHLEVIRSIIRGVKPETTGDVVEVADGYAKRVEEPDLDGGLARQTAETASREHFTQTKGYHDALLSAEAEVQHRTAVRAKAGTLSRSVPHTRG